VPICPCVSSRYLAFSIFEGASGRLYSAWWNRLPSLTYKDRRKSAIIYSRHLRKKVILKPPRPIGHFFPHGIGHILAKKVALRQPLQPLESMGVPPPAPGHECGGGSKKSVFSRGPSISKSLELFPCCRPCYLSPIDFNFVGQDARGQVFFLDFHIKVRYILQLVRSSVYGYCDTDFFGG